MKPCEALACAGLECWLATSSFASPPIIGLSPCPLVPFSPYLITAHSPVLAYPRATHYLPPCQPVQSSHPKSKFLAVFLEAGQQLRYHSRMKVSYLKKKRPLFALSLTLIIVGLALMVFLPWWFGLAVIIAGAAIDRVHWICGNCGNRLEKTSKLCGVCQCRLTLK